MSKVLPKLSVFYAARSDDTAAEKDIELQEEIQFSDENELYPVVEYAETESATDSILCRICYQQDTFEDLLSPCNCRGSIAYVHKTCLERSLSAKGKATCDLCFFKFDATYKRRYSLLQSLWVWITHPNTRAYFWLDFFSYLLLNIATVALFGMTLQSMDLFSKRKLFSNKRDAMAVTVTYGLSLFCSFLMLFIHFVASVTFTRFQILAWYDWWRTTFNIRLKN